MGEKGELLEWSLGSKEKQNCLGNTRDMEDEIFACKDGILMV